MESSNDSAGRGWPFRLRGVALALLLATGAGAHPLDENIVRYEVQAVALTGGLRIDLYVLHGGLLADEVWRRWDADGDLALTAAEQQAVGAELLADVVLTLDGRGVALVADRVVCPGHQAFALCEEPVVVRAEIDAVPRERAVRVEVGVPPPERHPALARVGFVAPRSVTLVNERHGGGAGGAVLVWPPADAPPDTRLPPLTVPGWFYDSPQDLDPARFVPTAGPSARAAAPGAAAPVRRRSWREAAPALALLALAGFVAWRSRRGRR